MERIKPRPGEEGAQLQVTPANEHQFTRGGGKGVGGWEMGCAMTRGYMYIKRF